MRKFKLLLATLAILTAGAAQAATYTIDPTHSNVGFKVRHMMVSNVRGSFDQFEGTITFEEGKLGAATVEATIQTASIDTDDEKRDEHLRSADFFDVEQYPEMTFRSTGVLQQGDDWKLQGDLTLHGITKPVTLDLEYFGTVEDPWGNTRAGFSAAGKIDRREFDITWNNTLDTGGLVVGNDVSIELEIEAIKQ